VSKLSPAGSPLGPGELLHRLIDLPVVIDSVQVDLGWVALRGYDDTALRPTAIVSLIGRGSTGRGECVAWSASEQARFAVAADDLSPKGAQTIGAVHRALERVEPYHAAALEAAAIDLALRQASTNLFALAWRPARPIMVCRSLGRAESSSVGSPMHDIEEALGAEPWARIKIDVDPEGWTEKTWAELGRTDRIVVVDFKLQGAVEQVRLAHHHLPQAWLEDPPATALDPEAPWRGRIAVDGYVRSTADLASLPLEPAAVNVKPARMGGPLEALRLLEAAARHDWASYVGGMFEAGPGRQQARILASLFTADAWNDVAPLGDEVLAPGPLPVHAGFTGFDAGLTVRWSQQPPDD
jgi:L-alanine-DL-glutamate epimerase-like enolase superfamily enzyme